MRKVMAGFLSCCLFVYGASSFASDGISLSIGRNPHPAAKMVKSTLSKGIKIVALKSDSAKVEQLCSLVKTSMATDWIGRQWLGDYAKLSREKSAVAAFLKLTPSIIVSRLMEAIDSESSGRIEVDPDVKSRGQDLVEVSTHIYNSKDQHYGVKVLVWTANGRFSILDGSYMGFSAVKYLAREYKRLLDREYNDDPARSMPVTELVRQTEGDSAFVRCP